MDPEEPVPAYGDGMMLVDLPAEAVRELVAVGGAGSGSPLLSLEVRHLAGALGRPGDGALEALRGRFAIFAVGFTPDTASERLMSDHCAAVRAALRSWDAGCGYLNFTHRDVDPSYFFTPQACARLRDVKRRYDPHDVIRSNHPIR
jgi:hypothetical protein